MQDKARAVLTLANQPAKDQVINELDSMQKMGKSVPEVTLDELIHLFIRRDAALFHERNPGLTPEEIEKLQHLLADYLEHATYGQHLNRFVDHMSIIKQAYSDHVPHHEWEELVKQFAVQSRMERAYKVSEHPELLILEYYMNILYRNRNRNRNGKRRGS